MQISASLNFEFRRAIGGQQGQNSDGVHIAYDPQLDGELVVKRIAKARLQMDPARYFVEARRLYDARHPNVVDVKYACADGDYIYIAMPCYTGGSIQSVLEQRFLTVREIIKYASEFLSGLHHIHTRGFVHFDIKPSNVLIDSRDTAALTDFGLTAVVDPQGLATPDGPLYTVHWPPEYAQRSHMSSVSDIYQAAVTLYRMCNGLDHFKQQMRGLTVATLAAKVAGGTFPDRDTFLPHIPDKLRKTIVKAMHPKAGKRHQTALDLLNDLADVDECLDWTYTVNPATGLEQWGEPADTFDKRVTVEPENGAFRVVAARITRASGRVSKGSNFGGTAPTRPEAWTLARTALTGL